jgi:hypothetical protein
MDFSLCVSIIELVVNGEKFKMGFPATSTLSAVVGDDFPPLFFAPFVLSFPMVLPVCFSPLGDSLSIAGLAV